MRPVPSREASPPNARVLIVDDDVSVTELFARMLRLEGFEVWAAHSADEGLVLAQTHRPHAVILDLRMPLTSGVQVLRSLRAIPGMQHTPVTIVTGDYYLAALADFDTDEWPALDLLDSLIAAGIKLTLADGEQKVQNIQIAGGGR